MIMCNFCKKKINKGKGVNIEISRWENEKDGDCIDIEILIEEICLKCSKIIIDKIRKENKNE